MSIVRVGLAETKNFSDGYDLIFGKKEDKEPKKGDQPEEGLNHRGTETQRREDEKGRK